MKSVLGHYQVPTDLKEAVLGEGSFFKLFVGPFECLHETNEVRKFLVIHSGLKPLRHERKTTVPEGFDFAAEQLPVAAVKEA